jgi:hypothetical protein
MSMRFLTLVRGAVTANLALFPISAQISAQAQSPAEFYRGKTIDLYVGYIVQEVYKTPKALASKAAEMVNR